MNSELMACLPEDLLLQLQALSPADQCLVHRVLYYVFAEPIMHDRWYDQLERMATNDPDTPVDHLIQKPGSDREDTYPESIVTLAYQIRHPELR